MEIINFEYKSKEKNRFNSYTYLFQCINDTNKLGDIVRCKMVTYGYIYNRKTFNKTKGWYVYDNQFFEKSKILDRFDKENGRKKITLYKHEHATPA